jgi:hypothetical protein
MGRKEHPPPLLKTIDSLMLITSLGKVRGNGFLRRGGMFMKQRLSCFHSVFLWFKLNSGQFSCFRSYVYFSDYYLCLGEIKTVQCRSSAGIILGPSYPTEYKMRSRLDFGIK